MTYEDLRRFRAAKSALLSQAEALERLAELTRPTPDITAKVYGEALRQLHALGALLGLERSDGA